MASVYTKHTDKLGWLEDVGCSDGDGKCMVMKGITTAMVSTVIIAKWEEKDRNLLNRNKTIDLILHVVHSLD